MRDAPSSQRVVVCGGGIIGAATAYYLATAKGWRHITIVDRAGLAAAASGRAGGFLALDWTDGTPLGRLARCSFALHERLAHAFGAEAVGYRRVSTFSVTGAIGGGARGGAATATPAAWLDRKGVRVGGVLGTPDTTAQVHPGKLTRALVGAAEAVGARVVTGVVEGLQLSPQDNSIQGVVVDGRALAADVAVLALGPWTATAAESWLPQLRGAMSAPTKYHSVVLRPVGGAAPPVGADCLFTSLRLPDGSSIEPEVYPRPDGSVYVCGEPQASAPLPADPATVSVEQQRCAVLERAAAGVSSALEGAHVEARQACYLPNSQDGVPLIGRLPGVPGAYVSTGHTCWGILNGPASGLALAELIADGAASCVDLAPFDPARRM